MRIGGDEAKNFNAVRLDNFENANRGELIEADDQTGFVKYKDAAGVEACVTLGERAIRIMPKGR